MNTRPLHFLERRSSRTMKCRRSGTLGCVRLFAHGSRSRDHFGAYHSILLEEKWTSRLESDPMFLVHSVVARLAEEGSAAAWDALVLKPAVAVRAPLLHREERELHHRGPPASRARVAVRVPSLPRPRDRGHPRSFSWRVRPRCLPGWQATRRPGPWPTSPRTRRSARTHRSRRDPIDSDVAPRASPPPHDSAGGPPRSVAVTLAVTTWPRFRPKSPTS